MTSLGEFLEGLASSGRIVPFELALRHRRERLVAGMPAPAPALLAASPAAAPPSRPPPRVAAPRSLAPGEPADQRVLYGSFANPAPIPGSVLRYIDAANFGWMPEGRVVAVGPSSGSTVTMAADDRLLYINNNAELADLTIRLPPDVLPGGTMVEIGFAHSVTVLAIRDAAGGAVSGAPTEVYGPGNALYFRYIDSVGWVFWK